MGSDWIQPAGSEGWDVANDLVDELAEVRGQRDAMQAALATIAARLRYWNDQSSIGDPAVRAVLDELVELAERAALGVDDDGG